MGAILFYLFFSLLFGSINCFYGNKIYIPMMMVSVFLFSVLFSISRFGLDGKALILGVIMGILLALSVRLIYRFGLMLLGGLSGLVLGSLLMLILPQAASDYRWMITLALSLFLALCALRWSETFIIVVTASAGATGIAVPFCFFLLNLSKLTNFIYADGPFATVAHLNEYLSGPFLLENSVILSITTLVLFVIGFYVQRKGQINH